MNIYIVIPAHNEEGSIGKTLDSLIQQTYLPKKLVVVNDNSSDGTPNIISKYVSDYDWISTVSVKSSDERLPGEKVINAFYKGLETLDDNYDIICKFDADLIFPENYLEVLIQHYSNNDQLGMVAGHCYTLKNGNWELERSTGKDHIRGALKSYRKKCFDQIGKLRRSIGWDTVDELLAMYYNWTFYIDPELKVKHLIPTSSRYHKSSRLAQGEAFYKMRIGLPITFLRSIKIAFRKRSFGFFIQTLRGYFKAKREGQDFIVDEDQGKFIRKLQNKALFNTIFQL
ncbi:MAG: glycosyltransferase family 2 protein [Flavobacteriaceae bacterium]|nr:glycosyltransferase family 2 protein [Flavobacteriaceae bacterium]